LKISSSFLFALACTITIAILPACKTAKKTATTPNLASKTTKEVRKEIPKGLRPPTQHNIPVGNLPPASAGKTAYLTTGSWAFIAAFQAADSLVFKQYEGKKLTFKEDFTFDILQDEKLLETGKWNFDSENSLIYLSCGVPYINATWQVMEKSFTMIWIGQTDYNDSGIQLKITSNK
jgi:hypothetical protein